MNEFILYGLFVLAVICVPVAYKMGEITGSEAMLRSRRNHPAFRAASDDKQIRETA